MSLLALRALDVAYGDLPALTALDLVIEAGEILSVVGANGAGKTTMLRAISGLLRPRAGEILLEGTRLDRLPSHEIVEHGVVQVPEGRKIFPSLTVLENLRVAIRKPDPECEARWEIEDVFGRFPALHTRQKQIAGSLSGGEQQMLAIGRALASNPRVLLMDEPSEGLAPRIVHEVGETLLALKAAGLSIVLVEQNATLALGVADDVAILNTGRIVHQGLAQDVRARTDLLNTHLGIV